MSKAKKSDQVEVIDAPITDVTVDDFRLLEGPIFNKTSGKPTIKGIAYQQVLQNTYYSAMLAGQKVNGDTSQQPILHRDADDEETTSAYKSGMDSSLHDKPVEQLHYTVFARATLIDDLLRSDALTDEQNSEDRTAFALHCEQNFVARHVSNNRGSVKVRANIARGIHDMEMDNGDNDSYFLLRAAEAALTLTAKWTIRPNSVESRIIGMLQSLVDGETNVDSAKLSAVPTKPLI